MSKTVIINTTKDGVARSQVAVKQSPTTPKSPKSGSTEDTLTKAMEMVNAWLAYRKKLLPKWERDIKLYNNERVEKHFEGVSDTFVPMTFSTIETMVSTLATGDLSTDYLPHDIYQYLKDRLMPGFTGTTTDEFGQEVEETEEQYLVRAIQNVIQGGVVEDKSLGILNALYDYVYDKGNWATKVESLIKSGLKIGNGALWMTLKKGLPKLDYVAFPDFIFDPDGSDDDSCRFMGRRYLGSLKELKEETITDPATGKTKKRYNLSGLRKKSTGSKEDKTDKELKEELLFGSTTDSASKDNPDQVEVIELRYDDRMVTIVNRRCLAEDVENPIIAQAKLRNMPLDDLITLPGISWANYKDESLYIGKSETETFWKEQERLNDTTNQKSDAVTRALLQTYRADPALKSQKKSFGVPGAVIWSTSGQYEPNPSARVPGEVFSEEVSIKNNIRETTATDQLVKGVGSSSDVTATEANLQVAQSGQRLEMKVESLSRGPLKRIALLALQYFQLFITDPFIVPRRANSGITPLLYDPSKYNLKFDPKVTLTVSAKNKRRDEQREARESYQILIQDPTNNLVEVKKIFLPKIADLDKDEVDRITSGGQAMPPIDQSAPQEVMA